MRIRMRIRIRMGIGMGIGMGMRMEMRMGMMMRIIITLFDIEFKTIKTQFFYGNYMLMYTIIQYKFRQSYYTYCIRILHISM